MFVQCPAVIEVNESWVADEPFANMDNKTEGKGGVQQTSNIEMEMEAKGHELDSGFRHQGNIKNLFGSAE